MFEMLNYVFVLFNLSSGAEDNIFSSIDAFILTVLELVQ